MEWAGIKHGTVWPLCDYDLLFHVSYICVFVLFLVFVFNRITRHSFNGRNNHPHNISPTTHIKHIFIISATNIDVLSSVSPLVLPLPVHCWSCT